MPLTVDVSGVGQFHVSPDPYGRFMITLPAPRTVDIRVKGSNTLGNAKAGILISSGTLNVDFGLLRTGDANGDNAVDVVDFSILRSQFGSANPQSDFSGDGAVDVIDFSLFRTNFGRSGDSIVADAK